MRQKPAEQVRLTVLCALFAGVKVAFLASGILGSSVVFGQEQVFVQGAGTHQQRAGEMVWPDDSKAPPKQFGAALSRVPEVVRHQLILNHNEGLVVDGIQKDSIADRIGLKPHDILVQFNEQYLLLPEQFSLLLESFLGQSQVRITKFQKSHLFVLESVKRYYFHKIIKSNLQNQNSTSQGLGMRTVNPNGKITQVNPSRSHQAHA